jgi:hypothetical protein
VTINKVRNLQSRFPVLNVLRLHFRIQIFYGLVPVLCFSELSRVSVVTINQGSTELTEEKGADGISTTSITHGRP